jgi:hypothetical protein
LIPTGLIFRAKFIGVVDGAESYLLNVSPQDFVHAAQDCGVCLEEGQTSFEAHESMDGSSESLTVVCVCGCPTLDKPF